MNELAVFKAVEHTRRLAEQGWRIGDAAREATRDTGLCYHQVRAYAGVAHAECRRARGGRSRSARGKSIQPHG